MKAGVSFTKQVAGINKTVNHHYVYFSLIMRSLFFIIFGVLIMGVLALNGSADPLKEAEKWWPFQAIFANILSLVSLNFFLKKENLSFSALFKSKKIGVKKTIKDLLLLIMAAVIGGGVPLYLFSYAFLGSFVPPSTMFQEIPLWAAFIALLIFPVTNALVELPIYMGYALPRLQMITGRTWIALVLAALGLALQHVFLPLIFEPNYMLWRLFSFLPLALMLGAIFLKTRRLSLIVIVHFLIDLQLISQTLLNSLN